MISSGSVVDCPPRSTFAPRGSKLSDMPCSDYHDHGPTPEEVRRQDIMCRLACEYCSTLKTTGKEIPLYAREWWQQHERDDKARIVTEAKRERVPQLVRSGLAKLTPKECEALGLRKF